MRVLQILHDRERGGVQALADMIEDGLRPHGIVLETAYLFPRQGLPAFTKLTHVAAMARRILRGGFDALLTYQATASILAGAVGRLQGCRLRIVHQTCLPDETAASVRAADKLVGVLGLYTINIANSAATAAAFHDYPARYRRTMTLIEHGLDAPAPTHGRAETRDRFGLPQASRSFSMSAAWSHRRTSMCSSARSRRCRGPIWRWRAAARMKPPTMRSPSRSAWRTGCMCWER